MHHPPWSTLLGPESTLEHHTRRRGFEKRIVRYGTDRYVLYRFPLRRHARRLAWLLQTAADAGAHIQRYLGHVESRAMALGHGGHWVATSFESGEPLEGVGTERHMQALGRLMARFHRLDSPVAYRLFTLTPTIVPYARRLRRELLGAVRQARASPAEQQALTDWLTRQGRFVTESKCYQLTHGDLYGRNIIIQDSADIVLVDYELAEFDLAGLELGTALLRAFCGQLPALRQRLLDAYLEECPPSVRASWEQNAAFFLAAAALRLSAKRRFRARRLTRLGRPAEPVLQQARTYYQWAAAIVDAAKQSGVDTEALLSHCQ